MKKIMFFLLVILSADFSIAQVVDEWDLEKYLTSEEKQVTEADLDNAFSTPMSKLIGKKWYYSPVDYIIFYKDNTYLKVKESTAQNYGKTFAYVIKVPGKWRRSGETIYRTDICTGGTTIIVPSSIANYTPRVQAQIKERAVDATKEMRRVPIREKWEDLRKITNDFFITNENNYYCSSKKLQELSNRRDKEIEERARAAEERRAEEQRQAEEEKFREELQAMNKQAYAYAREGNFDEAIATIDKVIELQPQNANWYDTKGEFLAKKGDKEGAKAMWEKVLSIDPQFGKNKSPLSIYIEYEGWQLVNESFPKFLPFKKIRVRKSKGVPGEYCFIYFTTQPDSNPRKEDTKYGVTFYLNMIYNGKDYYDKRFKKCIDVGDGWYEYEYSQPMYFSHIQKNAPKDCLQVLVE